MNQFYSRACITFIFYTELFFRIKTFWGGGHSTVGHLGGDSTVDPNYYFYHRI